MQHRKIIRSAVCAASLVLLTCLLAGCSASFAGFPLGGKEELQFICDASGGSGGDTDLEESRTAVLEQPGPESSGSRETAESTPEAVENSGDGGQEPPSGEAVQEPDRAGVTADGRIDLNTAGLEELMTLNGIGQTRAQAIIDYRTQQGAFTKIEDIMQIPGIKEGIFSKIRDEIVVR